MPTQQALCGAGGGINQFVALYRDLVAHWRLYDDSAVDAQGTPPSSVLLTKSGTPTREAVGQVSGYSIHLNGTPYLGQNDPSGQFRPAGSWTWRARFKFDNLAAFQVILAYGIENFAYVLYYNVGLNRITWDAYDTTGALIRATAEDMGAPSANVWYTAVAAYDDAAKRLELRVYPGIKSETPGFPDRRPTNYSNALPSGALRASTAVFRLGGASFNTGPLYRLVGNMSHFVFYKRLLNPAEERIVVADDYDRWPLLVWKGLSAPPPGVPAAPANLA